MLIKLILIVISLSVRIFVSAFFVVVSFLMVSVEFELYVLYRVCNEYRSLLSVIGVVILICIVCIVVDVVIVATRVF